MSVGKVIQIMSKGTTVAAMIEFAIVTEHSWTVQSVCEHRARDRALASGESVKMVCWGGRRECARTR